MNRITTTKLDRRKQRCWAFLKIRDRDQDLHNMVIGLETLHMQQAERKNADKNEMQDNIIDWKYYIMMNHDLQVHPLCTQW